MTYLATYGIYCNCSICGEEERVIKADNEQEAREIADKVGEYIEAEYASIERSISTESESDWWASLEDLTKEQE